MTDAQTLAAALNLLAKSPQFSYTQARATARKNPQVDQAATKARNGDFNPEVDGCETFVMADGSICEWMPGQQRYAAHT
ncbi:MAG: hypothetical protein M3N19_04540 [Candidatus Eremiobacteraeota bacterium]|nr:hypothetical protein [Candidatus Eremiobacteraeota bacterium]